MSKVIDNRKLRRLEAFNSLRDGMPEPSQSLESKALDCLNTFAIEITPRLVEVAAKLAGAIKFFAECHVSNADLTINEDVEHALRMEPVREFRELAERMKLLLDSAGMKSTTLSSDPDVFCMTESLHRQAYLVEQALDRSHKHRSASSGDPRASRYLLYVAVITAWYHCKKTGSVPPRNLNNEREPCGEFFEFLTAVFALTHYTKRNVSADEAHKAMLKMEASE